MNVQVYVQEQNAIQSTTTWNGEAKSPVVHTSIYGAYYTRRGHKLTLPGELHGKSRWGFFGILWVWLANEYEETGIGKVEKELLWQPIKFDIIKVAEP